MWNCVGEIAPAGSVSASRMAPITAPSPLLLANTVSSAAASSSPAAASAAAASAKRTARLARRRSVGASMAGGGTETSAGAQGAAPASAASLAFQPGSPGPSTARPPTQHLTVRGAFTAPSRGGR